MLPLPHVPGTEIPKTLFPYRKSLFVVVKPVELWATRQRRPSAVANPQGSCRPPTPQPGILSCCPGRTARPWKGALSGGRGRPDRKRSGFRELGRQRVPVLLGPKQRHYVIDHHYLARALEEVPSL